MKRILYVDPEKCSGCRMCEVVCSWYHENEFNPNLSRIKIISWKERSLDFPIYCEQCDKAPCKEVCPAGAVYQDKSGAFLIDKNKCIGCKLCLSACPAGAMNFNTKESIAIKCDLCEGEPKCVELCPMGAIEFVEADKIPARRKQKIAEKLLKGTTV